MNRLTNPSAYPTSLNADEAKKALTRGCSGFHESLLRSYHILELVKELLEINTPSEVILQVISLNETANEPHSISSARH